MTVESKPSIAKFESGRVVITRRAWDELDVDDILKNLIRHFWGDWGDLDPFDREQNDYAVMYGYRILSSYRSSRGVQFWVITEADRSVTTILLPDDY